MSGSPQAAERFIDLGLISTFSNLEFSNFAINGVLPPYVFGERNPYHRMWCLMLSTVAETTRNVQNPRHFRAVRGFIALYWRQLEAALDTGSDGVVSRGLLEEIECITQMLYSIAFVNHASATEESSAMMMDNESDWHMLALYIDLLPRLLEFCVFLLKHPNTLVSRYAPMSKKEKEGLAAGGIGDLQSATAEEAKSRLILIATFTITNNVETMLLQGFTRRSTGKSNADAGAISFTTLTESVSIVIDLLRRSKGKATATTSAIGTPVGTPLGAPKSGVLGGATAQDSNGTPEGITGIASVARATSPTNKCVMATQLPALLVGQGLAGGHGGEETKREVAETVQQIRSAVDGLSRESDANPCYKQVARELRDLERFFTSV
ncbi:hypothetical protein HDU76_008070 [Blyttiomyces sp. JEL0837]|nr:hypothetical protein HDU76_008070 [Blyttiomyces sp. JEL0837]